MLDALEAQKVLAWKRSISPAVPRGHP